MEFEFDVKIDAPILYDYMLHHAYTGVSGISGTAVGVLILIGYFKYHYMIYLLAGIVLILYLPWSLFLKSRQQAASNPAFKSAIHYLIGEEGITIGQGETTQTIVWDDIYKVRATGKSIFIYTSKIHASILPRRDMKEDTNSVIGFISSKVSPKKINIRF